MDRNDPENSPNFYPVPGIMMVIQTDQQTCFDENGNRMPCQATGQDGETRCGKAWPKPRFVPEQRIVKDMLSGLTWTRDGNPSEYPLPWQEARVRIEEMNRRLMFGYDDWRLPSRNELFEIVSHYNINPALPEAHPFVNVFPGYYWTGTACARLANQAWYVHLGGARVQRGIKQRSYLVWPVRGVSGSELKATGARRFHNIGKTVLDLSTGLEWIKDADVMGRPVDWMDAVDGVKELNRSSTYGYDDWRIPNIRELASLVDTNRHSPALSKKHPFINLQQAYWSATTSVYEPSYAWVVEIADGAVGVGFKRLTEFHTWYVRSGTDKE
jgi:hypothetical protein